MSTLTSTDRDWLAEVLPGERIVAVAPLTGGLSNENVRLSTDRGRDYVLRKQIRPGSTPTAAIEAALAERVRDVVPVPRVLAARERLLLTEFVPGQLASRVLDVDPFGLGHAIGATLVRIGTVEFDATGFFGAPDLVPDGTPVCADLARFVHGKLSGVAPGGLSEQERDLLVSHAEAVQPLLDSLASIRRLVHSDFNPKNLLVDRSTGEWVVTAVLDWEFAFSGPNLTDLGNVLRFESAAPPQFSAGVVAGYRDAGGELPSGWRAAAQALDLFALADLASRGPSHPLFDDVVAVLRARIDTSAGRD